MSTGRVKVGKATVSWGPRTYGPDMVVANAPVDAIADLVAAVWQAQAKIDPPEPLTYEHRPGASQCADCYAVLTGVSRHQVVTPTGLVYVCAEHYRERVSR